TRRIGDNIEYYDQDDWVEPAKSIQIVYDHGNIAEVWAPSEQGGNWPTLQYDYDSFGNLVKVHRLVDGTAAGLDFDERYQTITYDYNDPCGVFGPGEHYVFDIEDERGISPIMYYYDANGLLEAVRDAKGKLIEIDHDITGKTETVTDRAGNVTIYEYNERGNVVSIINALGRTTYYKYADQPAGTPGQTGYYSGNPDKATMVKVPLVENADPCDANDWSITRYVYDTGGRTTIITDPNWNVTKNEYGDYVNLTATIQARPVDPCASNPAYPADYIEVSRTKNEYTSNLLTKTELIDPNGTVVVEQTEYFYDGKNRITDVNKVDPNDSSNFITVTHYTYDNDGNFPSSPNSVTDAAGFRTYFEYDRNGSQVKSWYNWVDANDAGRTCTVTTITEYDAAGRVTRTLRDVGDATGGVQEYTIVLSETIYDAIGKPDTVYDQYGNATVYSYDEAGNLVETLVYDPCGTLLTVSETLYDVEGRVLVTVGPHDPCEIANGTENIYDELGRVVATCRWADVDVNLVDLVVDGNVVGKKVAEDADPNNAWEGTGEPPSGLNFGWTVNGGSLPVVGDELSYTLTEYDAAGRVLMTISLDENGYEWPTSYEYDKAGKQITVIDPCGHDIQRDANGATISADVNSLKGHRTETEYKGTRHWKVTNALNNTTEFEYDGLGRVLKTIYQAVPTHGVTYSHTGYDAFGRRWWQSSQVTESDADLVDYSECKYFNYDSAGRLAVVSLPEVNDPC
ncbi:MAG: hypothetical protein ACYS21_15235, partial [Planctomycetota bacterium]